MLNSRIRTPGFYPADLNMLRRVFEVLCAESCFLPDSVEAQATAIRLVNLFESGRNSEDELLEGARPCMQRRLAG